MEDGLVDNLALQGFETRSLGRDLNKYAEPSSYTGHSLSYDISAWWSPNIESEGDLIATHGHLETLHLRSRNHRRP